MKSRWVFQNLTPHLPNRTFSLITSFKTLTSQNPFPKFVLNNNNIVDIPFLLSLCGREGHFHLGTSLHASILKDPFFFDLTNPHNSQNAQVVWNSLLAMYSKCGQLCVTTQVFDHMPMRDTVSWNTLISGLLRYGELELGFWYFKRMCDSGIYRFDHASLTTILSVCDGPCFVSITNMVHGLVFLSGFEKDISVGNALITSYFKCGCFDLGRRVFEEMIENNVVTWTAVISGLAQNEFYEESLELFWKMRGGSVEPNFLTYLSALLACCGLRAMREGCQIHGLVWKLGIQSDLHVESALMDMYSKCGSVGDAWQIFESAEVLDEVSLTVILVGFAQNGFEEEAIQIFVKMVNEGIEIDPNVVSAILGVFGVGTSLALGEQIHSIVIKRNFGSNTFVSNGLINMYSKCGDLEEAVKVFAMMDQRSPVSWNSMIAAFARHGNGPRAIQLYEEMILEGLEPTDVTFLSLLHACSHVGSVGKGMEFLESMDRVYGISPRMEHYACIVDMLGRAGLLDDAKSFIEGLLVKPGILIWQALLGACCIQGDTEMGKYAADQLFLASPHSPAPYILLANIYSSKGRWKERARTIKKMKEIGVAKEPGISWIEIEKKVHSFVVGDQMHPQVKVIYDVLLELFRHMRDEGYMPDKKFILYYLDQDEEDLPKDSPTALTTGVDSRLSERIWTNQR